MKLRFGGLLIALLAVAGCGQPNYVQGCSPDDPRCGQPTTMVQHDHSGAILAGAAGLGAGALLMHHHYANQARQMQAVPYGYGHPYGYHQPYDVHHVGGYYPSNRTVVVHHYGGYGNRVVHVYHH